MRTYVSISYLISILFKYWREAFISIWVIFTCPTFSMNSCRASRSLLLCDWYLSLSTVSLFSFLVSNCEKKTRVAYLLVIVPTYLQHISIYSLHLTYLLSLRVRTYLSKCFLHVTITCCVWKVTVFSCFCWGFSIDFWVLVKCTKIIFLMVIKNTVHLKCTRFFLNVVEESIFHLNAVGISLYRLGR